MIVPTAVVEKLVEIVEKRLNAVKTFDDLKKAECKTLQTVLPKKMQSGKKQTL